MDTALAAPDTSEALAQFRSAMAEEFRALETDELLSRYRFARSIGATFGGRRDLYHVLGYERVLTVEHYRERYERGGIAGAVVDTMPNATWNGELEVIEDETELKKTNYTKFETEAKKLFERLSVISYLRKVDVLSRLSTFGGLLIGVKDVTPLAQELPKGNGSSEDITFLQPYCGGGGWRLSGVRSDRTRSMQHTAQSDIGGNVTIKEWETDLTSPRFGWPKIYQLRNTNFSSPTQLDDVHWSRVIHVAEDTLDDDVFGRPALARCWNLFDDLEKVEGGGSEAYWLRANKGLQLDIAKEFASLGEEEKKDLKDQAEKYVHEMTRVLRTRGVTVKELGSDVANFANPGDFIVTLIAGSVRIPKRILTGSEMGELASSQDRENFRDVVRGRQQQYAGPLIVRRLMQRLIDFNYLPTPKQIVIKWPETNVLTEDERAAGALKWAQVNAAAGVTVFSAEEIRNHWYGMEPGKPVDTEAWKADLALKMANVNKTQGTSVFTSAEIRKTAYGWEPLDPKDEKPIGMGAANGGQNNAAGNAGGAAGAVSAA